MTWLAVTLIGIGLADLVRSRSSTRSHVLAHVVAPVTILVTAVVSGLHGWADGLALLVAAVGSAAWIELSARTQRDGQRAGRALGALAATLVVPLLFSGAATSPDGLLGRWLRWADVPGPLSPEPSRVLLLAGLVLLNVATANVLVRLVLLTIGALRPDQVAAPPVPQPADRLKGGRLLGPMERLVILGLGLAGEFAAAGLVIAAKGLLRFPEIQASARSHPTSAGTGAPSGSYPGGPAGIDDVTEYFLVGSFVSWIVALASLALAA